MTAGRRYTPELFFAGGVRTGDCLLWPGALTDGRYAQVTYQGRAWVVQRLAYTLSTGETLRPAPADVVRQSCGNFTCIEPSHLRRESLRRDLSDEVAAIHAEYGDLMPAAGDPITETHRSIIRREHHQAGTSQRCLAQAFGLTRSAVGRITRGEPGMRSLVCEPGRETGR